MKIPIKKGWLGQVIQQGRPIQFLAINRKQETEPLMPTAKAFIAVPISSSSRIHGAIAVDNTEPHRWSEEDGHTVVAIAKILAVQLEQLLVLTKGKNSSPFPISGIRT